MWGCWCDCHICLNANCEAERLWVSPNVDLAQLVLVLVVADAQLPRPALATAPHLTSLCARNSVADRSNMLRQAAYQVSIKLGIRHLLLTLQPLQASFGKAVCTAIQSETAHDGAGLSSAGVLSGGGGGGAGGTSDMARV